jgi:hypothetical protein
MIVYAVPPYIVLLQGGFCNFLGCLRCTSTTAAAAGRLVVSAEMWNCVTLVDQKACKMREKDDQISGERREGL